MRLWKFGSSGSLSYRAYLRCGTDTDTPTATVDHYFELLASLSASEKLALIARLSAQIAQGWSIDRPAQSLGWSELTERRPSLEERTDRERGEDAVHPKAWRELRGKWPDTRNADEIVAEIRSHRSPPREALEF